MLKTRIILLVACVAMIWLIFLLPKSVVENQTELKESQSSSGTTDIHSKVDAGLQKQINRLRAKLTHEPEKRNSAIFADSLAGLYQKASRFDSAAWYAEQANMFFETTESIEKTGMVYFQAFSFAMDRAKRNELAGKTRIYFNKVLEKSPGNLDVKTKLALTYIGTDAPPMQGINLLREVLAENPKFQPALYNMGMLSVQSGQYGKAIEWLTKLLELNPDDVQGTLLLGVAYANVDEKDRAREQFEKAKKLDSDPAVQQQADTYLKDLK